MRRVIMILIVAMLAGVSFGVATTEGLHVYGLYGDAYHTITDDRIVAVLDCTDGTESAKAYASQAANWVNTFNTDLDVTDSDYSRGNGATVKFTGAASQTYMISSCTFAATDLTKCFCAIAYYVEDNEHLTYLLFEIRTDVSNYYQTGYLPITEGWHYVEFDITGGCKTVSSPNIANITSAKIQCGLISANPCNAIVHIDSIRFIKNQAPSGLSKPVVMLSFDDGLDEHYDTVRGILNFRGIKANFGIVADWVGDAGYMTAAEITRLEADGHLICNHSYAHTRFSDKDNNGVHNDPLKYYERVEQIIRGKEYCLSQGWETAGYYYIHPGGTGWMTYGNSAANGTPMPAAEQVAAIRFLLQNYPIVRLTFATGAPAPRPSVDGMIARHEGFKYTFPNGGSCQRLQYALQGSDLSTLQNHKDVIDLAVASNSMATFVWHGVGDGGDITVAGLTALIDYAIAQGCEFVTMADVQPKATVPDPPSHRIFTAGSGTVTLGE